MPLFSQNAASSLEAQLSHLASRAGEVAIDCGSAWLGDDKLLNIIKKAASSTNSFTLETNGADLTPRLYFRFVRSGKTNKVTVCLATPPASPTELSTKIKNNLDFYAYLLKTGEIENLIIKIPAVCPDFGAWQKFADEVGASLALSSPVPDQNSLYDRNELVEALLVTDGNENLQAGNEESANSPASGSCDYTECWEGLELREYQKYLIELVDRQTCFRDKIVLELGSDVNLNTAQAMIRLGAKKVYAVNPALDADLKAPLPGIIPVAAFGEQTGFPDESFDLIFGIALLEHVSNLDAFAREYLRMCKTGGACFLQGNPLWTWQTGHHTYIASSPKTGLPYFYSNSTTPYAPWEHLTISNDEEAAKRLRAKGIDERDIQLLTNHLLREPFISRRTPTEIEKTFRKIFGGGCRVDRGERRVEPNDHFRKALEKYSEEDLRCEDIRISFVKGNDAGTEQAVLPIAFLGHTAFPAHLFRMLGLMEDVNGGQGPFDYTFAPYHKIAQNLANTFSDLGKDLHHDSQKGYWIDRAYEALFNHDNDCGAHDKDILQSRIDKRVRHFRETALDTEIPVFVFSAYFLSEPEQKITQLANALRSLRQDRRFMLLTLGEPDLLGAKLPREVVLITAQFPVASLSEWWQPENRVTDAAKNFCKKIKHQLDLVVSAYRAIAG